MARQASSKPDSGSPSTAIIGFEVGFRMNGIRPAPNKPARRGSANLTFGGTTQVVCAARDYNANFDWVQHFNRTQFSPLVTLRDKLLPKLLSGDLSVATVRA